MIALTSNLIVLMLVSVLPAIWFPWIWKITGTLAFLAFLGWLTGVAASLKIEIGEDVIHEPPPDTVSTAAEKPDLSNPSP